MVRSRDADTLIKRALGTLVRQRAYRTLIVGSCALTDERGCSISLEVGDGNDGRVYGELLVVGSKTVAMRVWVREQTRLQNRIGGWFNVRNQVRWRERRLLDFRKVVLNIFIEGELADGS